MKLLVVFSALVAVACASLVPLAQPAHHPALLLDPHGRPLDTADVINARAIHLQAKALEPHGAALVAHAAVAPVVAPAVVAAPAAVSHQSRVDVRTSPAIVTAHASPVLAAYSAYSSPLLGHSALGFGHGHLLKKRSLGHIAYAAPILAHATPVIAAAPSAVTHQSRVDIVSSPAVVSHAIAAPAVAHAVVAPVVARAAYAPLVAHTIAPAAVSHQSRVDVRTSPAVVSHSIVAAPIIGAHSSLALSGHGHLLKKRSLGHIIAPVAVSRHSRVDVVSRPAIVSHSVVSPMVAHAVPVVPLVRSASHFLHAAPLVHAAHY